MKLGILEDIMLYDDHIDSDKENSISVTTLLGAKYKAMKYINNDEKDPSLVDMKFKRSSFIGTSIHSRAEHITKDLPGYETEMFVEREIIVGGLTYTVAGSFDGMRLIDNVWYMYDYKSFYGNKRSEEALAKDAKQMSLYRWIMQKAYPQFNISDTAFSIAISQSNNYMEEIPVELMDIDKVTDFVEDSIYAITTNTKVDCNDGIKYSACAYCTYLCNERK